MSVNISDYSGEVVAGDWGPAFLAAFTALKTTGGTLNIDTDILIKSRTDLSGAYTNMRISSNNGSVIGIEGVAGHPALYFANTNRVVFQDITFIGNNGQSETPDCRWVLYAGSMERLVIQECTFAGIYAEYSLVTVVTGAALTVVNSKFGGCGGIHLQVNTQATGMTVKDCEFYDYEVFAGVYYDRQGLRPNWIDASAPPPSSSASTGRIHIADCRFDEGAGHAIDIADFPRVTIERCSSNLGGGIYLDGVERATINDYWAGYGALERPAIGLTDCGDVTVDHLMTHNGIHPILRDGTTRLTVTNSPDAVIDPPLAPAGNVGSQSFAMALFGRVR